MKYLLIACLFVSSLTFSQQFKVSLDSLDHIADSGQHIEIFTDEPNEKLILPKVDAEKHKFFTLFYSRDTQNDELISIMVVQKPESDLLYVDKNNDEDLTNDGEPIIFSFVENKKQINIQSENDKEQIAKLVIFRTPELPDSLKKYYVDEKGNLNPEFAKIYAMSVGKFDYKGEKGTFYFDDRLGLRIGTLRIDGEDYLIGLHDVNNNGLFNDERDVVIIDLNEDGKLAYTEGTQVFRLNDVFRIGNDNYQLDDVDKYGNKLTMSKTSKKATNYYLEYIQKVKSLSQGINSINQEFWNSSFTTITWKTLNVDSLKGKYILLNFWGEWCKPCLDEIPELKIAHEQWKDKVYFLSFLKPANFERAKGYIEKEKIIWDQVVLDKEIEDGFKIASYPTNILILPDGKTYLKEGQINRTFFDMNIK
ncbi:MAG: TlpA disulfide reductase family protein [Ignavibacteria bacterium]|nr:TlpA disulfide reductase family protein [Ignavibacteria bacterium]